MIIKKKKNFVNSFFHKISIQKKTFKPTDECSTEETEIFCMYYSVRCSSLVFYVRHDRDTFLEIKICLRMRKRMAASHARF